MSNELDIFNLSVDDVETFEQEKFESEYYKPSADDAKDSVYKALIRFVPFYKDPKNSMVRKYSHYLQLDGQGKTVDSPSTVGQSCPISDVFFKLRNSKNASDVKLSNDLKRREVYFSIVKILKDEQHPELVGKYKIFKYGIKIKQKIDEELKPTLTNDEGVQVFNPINGKDFMLIITKVQGFNNYDKSKFANKQAPLLLNDEDGKPTVSIKGTKADQAKILEELKEQAPDLSKYMFKPWDDETRDYVNKVLAFYSGGSVKIENAVETVNNVKENSNRPVIDMEENDMSSNETLDETDDELDDLLADIDF